MIGSSGEIAAAARSSVSFEGALSAGIEPGIFCCSSRNGGRTRVRRYVCDGEVRLLVPFQCVAVALQRETNLAHLARTARRMNSLALVASNAAASASADVMP